MRASPLNPLLKLSSPEKIQLVFDLWDSLEDSDEVFDLTKSQKVELDKRLKKAEEDSFDGIPWPMLKAKLRSRK